MIVHLLSTYLFQRLGDSFDTVGSKAGPRLTQLMGLIC